jgi:hypothetical protein
MNVNREKNVEKEKRGQAHFLKCRMLICDPFFTENSNGKMCPLNLEMLNVKTRPLRIVAEKKRPALAGLFSYV